MSIPPREIPFSTFLYATLIANLVYGIPTIGAFLLFDLMDTRAVLLIFLFVAAIKIPLTAALAWLIAKGSNWVNSYTCMVVACAVPAAFYGVMLGGGIGIRLFGALGGGIGGAILMFVITAIIRIPLGNLITRRLLSPAQLTRI